MFIFDHIFGTRDKQARAEPEVTGDQNSIMTTVNTAVPACSTVGIL